MKLLLTASATSLGSSVPPSDETTVQTKLNASYDVEAGDIGEITTTATCNGKPAKVDIFSYTFAARTVDRAGYRPTLPQATAPKYLQGVVPSSENGFPVFPLPNPSTQIIGISGQATGGPCGTWPLKGEVQLEIKPLLPIPSLDVSGNSILGNFTLVTPEESSRKVWEFNFGSDITPNPGFKYEQDVTFHQHGWVGVIQLIKGDYSIRAKDGKWQPTIFYAPDYIHDNFTPPGPDPILDKFQVAPGRTVTVTFKDTPGIIDLAYQLQEFPKGIAMRINVSFQTILMFNPSTSLYPTTDPNTIWYPLSAGAAWEINGKIEWNGMGSSQDLTQWAVTRNQSSKTPYNSSEFPIWKDYVHDTARGAFAPELSAVEVSSKKG